MLKVLIIEDEELAAEKLVMLLSQLDYDIQIMKVLATTVDSINWLTNNTADLIFMDINLSDNLSFKIFERVVVDTPIIFTTAYDQYAIKAFEQNSIAYLLKPIDIDSLKWSLEKFFKIEYKQGVVQESIKNLIENYSVDRRSNRKRIMVTYKDKIISVPIEEIMVFYIYLKSCYLITQTGDKYSFDEPLDSIEKNVNNNIFFRANRRHIININSIKSIYKYSTRKLKVELVISTPEEILIPSERITKFKEWLNN